MLPQRLFHAYEFRLRMHFPLQQGVFNLRRENEDSCELGDDN